MMQRKPTPFRRGGCYENLDKAIAERAKNKELRKNEKVVNIAENIFNKNMMFGNSCSGTLDLSKKNGESKREGNKRILLVLLIIGGGFAVRYLVWVKRRCGVP